MNKGHWASVGGQSSSAELIKIFIAPSVIGSKGSSFFPASFSHGTNTRQGEKVGGEIRFPTNGLIQLLSYGEVVERKLSLPASCEQLAVYSYLPFSFNPHRAVRRRPLPGVWRRLRGLRGRGLLFGALPVPRPGLLVPALRLLPRVRLGRSHLRLGVQAQGGGLQDKEADQGGARRKVR